MRLTAPGTGWRARLAGVASRLLSAAVFGTLLLVAIIATRLVWSPDWALARYDFLLLYALSLQLLFLVTGIETRQEALAILAFHVTGTVMELFKTHMGSWSYPEPALFRIAGVPLFAGFMYASVGSFILRAANGFDIRFENFPPLWAARGLALLVYLNFFGHHFGPDLRLALMAGTLLLFLPCIVRFPGGLGLPFPLVALGTCAALWIAETVGTLTGTWTYGGGGGMARLSLLGSWYLLLFVSFMLVSPALNIARAPWKLAPGPRVIERNQRP